MPTQRVLFVCLGNICRSPTAEGVFQHMVDQAGADIEVDSCGTGGWHSGERADARMRKHATKRGYDLTSRARAFDRRVDFEAFDLIVAMDDSNLSNLRRQDRDGRYAHKLVKMTDYCSRHRHSEVPDPYYGGAQGFELVIDIIEDASEGLLAELTR
jgi:protein-tyrosine phosphatase